MFLRTLAIPFVALVVMVAPCVAGAAGHSARIGKSTARPAAAPASLSIGLNEDLIGDSHGLEPAEKVWLIKNMGGSVLRTNLDWRSVEPQQDSWDEDAWARANELYSTAIGQGLRPIFIIANAPDWARAAGPRQCGPGSGPGQGRCEMPPTPAMRWEWGEYAAEVARRFPLAIIEVWNEPNLSLFWRPAPQPRRYARLFSLAYRAIKQTSPETTVLLAGLLNLEAPGLGGMPMRTFTQGAFRVRPNIARMADGIGVHAYPGASNIGPGSLFSRTFRTVRSIRDRAGAFATPLYVTETGLSTGGPDYATPTEQADTLARIRASVGRMRDVRALVFHRLLGPQDATSSPWEQGSSMLAPGEFPPPPRPAYCTLTGLAGHSYPGC